LLAAIESDLPFVIQALTGAACDAKPRRCSGVRATHSPRGAHHRRPRLSIARAISRVVDQQHRQLLVCGSSHCGPAGEVSIGRTTRQLLDRVPCSLAIAPED